MAIDLKRTLVQLITPFALEKQSLSPETNICSTNDEGGNVKKVQGAEQDQ
jgi:hypothetical protein